MDGLAEAGTVDAPEWRPVQDELFSDSDLIPLGGYPIVGMSIDGNVREPTNLPRGRVATNLHSFLDHSCTERLSPRASNGLLRRLDRSGHVCPERLRLLLEELAELDPGNGDLADE